MAGLFFSTKRGQRPQVADFIAANKEIFSNDINEYVYISFSLSKKLDDIREYSDTSKRIFKATGIIKFDNGYAELAYRELCECIFDREITKHRILGNLQDDLSSYYETYNDYEGDIYSYFCSTLSLCEIYEYDVDDIASITNRIRHEFPDIDSADIHTIVSNRRKQEFESYINRVYPINTVVKILSMFNDRKNDKRIKESVSPDATVPTIYEYMVGIAWYYFSGKKIDLLSSFNLTLSANFEPLLHAGGGQGDIVIRESNRVVMLEATLMNANSQKRGEWEPVLRHSTNLKVEEELSGSGRDVISFFIADEFDLNSINIWKAIAQVPLESSVKKGQFTDNVIIMPISTNELSSLLTQSGEYDKFISKIKKLFEIEKNAFDLEWRNKFIKSLL